MLRMIFLPRHTLVAGYYVFTLAVHVAVRPSVVRTFVRNSFPFDNLSTMNGFHFRFCICICTNTVSLGIVNGQISIIYHRVMALVTVQKSFLASSSFMIWSIMMKLHKTDRSIKNSILVQKFCHLRLSALALGLYTCIKS